MTRSNLLASASAFILSFSAGHATAQSPGGHDAGLSEIVVTAAPYARSRLDVLQNTSVVEAEALDRALRGGIGETLAGLPGVASTSFGPGASRPVLRGLQGERVRTLTDGIGSIDVANTSADHAVAIDPLIADRIEVLRGPATLLYGSSALGGVVNVISRRVPQNVPDAPMLFSGRIGYGTAANEFFAGGAADASLGGGLVLHVDGSTINTGDLSIPGFAESKRLRLLEGESDDEAQKDTLPNSDVRTTSAGVGLSMVGERGYLGASVSYYDSNYGIPGGTVVIGVNTGDDDDDDDDDGQSAQGGQSPMGGGDEGPVRLDLNQVRVDVGAKLNFDAGVFDSLALRFGYADYEHAEIEQETGEIGTEFFNTGWEGRLELVQRARGDWRGAFGVQAMRRNFEAQGEEAFVPPNITNQWGLFVLQEWSLAPLRFEASARLEHTGVSSRQAGFDRNFTTLSAALGAAYTLAPEWSLGLTASRTARAPAAEELLADGPHAATGTYEIGDPGFKTEKGLGLEASLKGRSGPLDVTLSLYFNRFDDFIIETATGAVEDDLPVFQFIQTDARTWGAELDVSAQLLRRGDWTLVGDVIADITRGRDLDRGSALPRFPQARARFGLEAQSAWVDGRIELELVGKQNRVSAFELPTDGYEMLNASLAVRPFGRERDVSLLLQVNNLGNVDARRSTSFLKDTVPLGGRDVRISLQAGF
jgi:iron complex outermembrane recepter protein